MPDEQRHFSLMAEYLDDDMPEAEKIEALREHARKEFGHVTGAMKRLDRLAAGNPHRAYLLNDVATAMQSAVSRIMTCWEFPDTPIEDSPEHIDFIRRFVVPELEKVRGAG